MDKKNVFRGYSFRIVVGITLLSLMLVGGADAATLSVCSSGCTYSSIQTAINAASNGDTVIVYSGTYSESVNVNKPLILKGIDNGGGKPIIKPYYYGNVAVALGSGSSTIDGFVIQFGSVGVNVGSANNLIINNTLSNNQYGILSGATYYTSGVGGNVIKENTVLKNDYGIYLGYSNDNILSKNDVKLNNYYGISLQYSNNNSIRDNTITDNDVSQYIDAGIELWEPSNNNEIYNNLFNNSNNFRIVYLSGSSKNSWNTTKSLGINIVGGPYLGGNFWALPNGKGFSQTCQDADSDGICDSSYTLGSNNTDYLPLASKSIPTPAPTPTFNISGFKINGSDGSSIAGWNITLSNSTMQKSIPTDGAGEYLFIGLVNGTYTVTEETKSGITNITPLSQDVTILGNDITNVNFTNVPVMPTRRVAYIPMKDQYSSSYTPIDIGTLKERSKYVSNYYNQQSYGKEILESDFVFDDWSHQVPYNPNINQLINDAINAARTSNSKFNQEYSNYDAVIILFATVQDFNPRSEVKMKDCNKPCRGIVNEKSTYGAWAHELGHAAFGFIDRYGWEGIDFGQIGYWGLMGHGGGTQWGINWKPLQLKSVNVNPPAPVESEEKNRAGWLKDVKIEIGSSQKISLLKDEPKYYYVIPTKGKIVKYIIEGRIPPDSVEFDPLPTGFENWEFLSKTKGILLYQYEDDPQNPYGKLNVIPWCNAYLPFELVSTKPTLVPDGSLPYPLSQCSNKRDFIGSEVSFEVSEINGDISLNVQPLKPINVWLISLSGIKIQSSTISTGLPAYNSSPDVDLKVFDSNGGMVGMNYSSGEYELGIAGANTSGDIPGEGSEWISVPLNTSVYSVIDASPAKKWAEENNVTISNITAEMQVVQYNESGARTESKPVTINVSLEKPIIIELSALLPPEAVIRFDNDSKDIEIYNSKTGSVANYVVMPSKKDNNKEESDENSEKAWKLRQYTLKDSADNSLVLVLKHKKEGKEAKVRVVSMQYNGGAVIKAANNSLQVEYSDTKGGALKELNQDIEVKGRFEAEANYNAKKNETEIKVNIEGQKEKKETRTGVVMLELLTDKGGLKYKY